MFDEVDLYRKYQQRFDWQQCLVLVLMKSLELGLVMTGMWLLLVVAVTVVVVAVEVVAVEVEGVGVEVVGVRAVRLEFGSSSLFK